VFTAGTPWLDGATYTVGGGSLVVSNAVTVNAQNIAENVPNQILGGFEVEAKGEEISVGSIVFNMFIGSDIAATTLADVTNITLVRQSDNAVVAGPVDGVASGTSGGDSGTVTFSDTVTFKPGKAVYVLKGKLGTDFANNQTITASTTPSSNWSSVTGQTTGDTITPSPSTVITANAMTLKSANLAITVGTTPVIQTIVAGSDFTFARLNSIQHNQVMMFV
jgi:hypothetical protein